MGIWRRLSRLISGSPPGEPLAARRERREAARTRHHETGEPAWTAADRHPGPDGEQLVADVTPGTPGHFGSVHTSRDD
jgi:hypothetical protein